MRIRDVSELPVHLREQVERQLRGEAPRAVVLAPDSAQPCAPADRKRPRRSKFGAVKVRADDQIFDSKLEYDCYCWLLFRKLAGEILFFVRQVPFHLEGGVVYKADFLCVLPAAAGAHHHEVWDAKGLDLQDSINKRKQVLSRYGVRVGLWPKEADLAAVV